MTAVFSQALLHMRAKYELVLSQRQLVTSLLETQVRLLRFVIALSVSVGFEKVKFLH